MEVAVEITQIFDFIAPTCAAAARLRARLLPQRTAAYGIEPAEARAAEVAPDHSRSPAWEAIRIVCEQSSPPGA
jgi:hypothetical protein